jgi:cytochrome c-type biogenesis protein CcmH
MLWVAFAMMTSAVVLALVWPLFARHEEPGARASDIIFYRSLLTEADDDVRCGLVAPEDAATTRAELERRLLASIDSTSEGRPRVSQRRWPRRVAVVAAVVVLPILALASYLRVGAPSQPDMPVASRRTVEFTPAAAISEIEAHLAINPNDGRGLRTVAPIYLRMGRFQDAARAYEAALRLLGENAQERASLGQALVMAANGVVTTEARAAFDQALVEDPKQPIARFFQAIAVERDGNKNQARQLWEALKADTPSDAPWMDAVLQHLTSLSEAPQSDAKAAHSGQAPADVAALSPKQRTQAIRGMVDGLAEKLAKEGHDLEGWLKLIRSYAVLDEHEKAEAAVAMARTKLSADARAATRIDELVRQLGLKG